MNKKNTNNIIVGVKARTYPEERNFSGLDINGIRFTKVNDLYKYPAYAYFKIKGKPHSFWLNLFYDLDTSSCDVLHFFNAVSLGHKPWITTFEYYLPRGASEFGKVKSEEKYITKVLNRVADDSCKQIIALSQFAYEAQKKYLSNFQHLKKGVIAKMRVMHPPQELLIQNMNQKPINKKLNFVLIGADFFRKGGLEVLRVFDKLLNQKLEIHLSIVSRMQFGDYASRSTKLDVDEARNIIDKNRSINYNDFLPNKEVLGLLMESDVALLPSYEETYGYTVLEAQASGCPVITTNGTAFQEINNNEIGWVIEVPLDKDQRSVPRTEKAKHLFQKTVEEELENIILEIIKNSDIVKLKGEKALHKIKNMHDPERFKLELKKMYKESIAK